MSCGKRPLVKSWDKPRNIRVIKPSRYEQNEAHVKVHWKNVCKELELSYKDEQFWETNSDAVRELVGPVIFERITKIFELPVEEIKYEPRQEPSSIISSQQFYVAKHGAQGRPTFSISDFIPSEGEEAVREEESEAWTDSTVDASEEKRREKLTELSAKSLHINTTKSLTKMLSKSFSRFMSKMNATHTSRGTKSIQSTEEWLTPPDTEAESGDDLHVRHGSIEEPQHRPKIRRGNPYFDMLYCNESETDMIRWKSKYKQKIYEVSASDEFSKRAEIMTKKISNEFFEWWVGLGNVEFKSEIKRPEDIEALFQVWFDEHASRGLVLDPKIIPCVIRSIASFTGVHKASCLNALKRQIAYDITAETNPAHKMAFGTSLPHHLMHIPPQNNTAKQWRGVRIPEDLRSMACVWEDIQHLTSTKAFQQWLVKHPNLPMPPFLKQLHAPGVEKKQPFVVPSDYVLKDRGSTPSSQDLALPVSQFSIELKEVLSKLMNQ